MMTTLNFVSATNLNPVLVGFGSSGQKIERYIPHLREYLPIAGISLNRERLCHFLAQISHESGGFLYDEEIADGSAYENRLDLGNNNLGDGKRYKGRGLIQLTGRFNYRKYGRYLGVDLEANPELAKKPDIAVKVACIFWVASDLNYWADKGDLQQITRSINGGLNGYDNRLEWLRAYMNRYDGLFKWVSKA